MCLSESLTDLQDSGLKSYFKILRTGLSSNDIVPVIITCFCTFVKKFEIALCSTTFLGVTNWNPSALRDLLA